MDIVLGLRCLQIEELHVSKREVSYLWSSNLGWQLEEKIYGYRLNEQDLTKMHLQIYITFRYIGS